MGFVTLAAVLGVVVTLLTAELALRALRPSPRRTLVTTDVVGPLALVGEVPVWSSLSYGHGDASARLQTACDPKLPKVVLAGTSITYGVELAASDTFGARIAQELAARGQPACVHNVAVPGFSAAQVLAVAHEQLRTRRPAALMVELWGMPTWPYVLGDVLVPVADDPQDPWAGNPLHLPRLLEQTLLSRAHLYLYALAARSEAQRKDVPPWFVQRMDALLADASAQGTRVVFLLPTRLDRPWSDPDRDPDEAAWARWVTARDLDAVRAHTLLSGHELASLRVDAVHLSATGHTLLAEALLDRLAP